MMPKDQTENDLELTGHKGGEGNFDAEADQAGESSTPDSFGQQVATAAAQEGAATDDSEDEDTDTEETDSDEEPEEEAKEEESTEEEDATDESTDDAPAAQSETDELKDIIKRQQDLLDRVLSSREETKGQGDVGEAESEEDEDIVFHSDTEELLYKQLKATEKKLKELESTVEMFKTAAAEEKVETAKQMFDSTVDKLAKDAGLSLTDWDRQMLLQQTASQGAVPLEAATIKSFKTMLSQRGITSGAKPVKAGGNGKKIDARKAALVDTGGGSIPAGSEGETSYREFADGIRAACRKHGIR